jgi:hypothetical protein
MKKCDSSTSLLLQLNVNHIRCFVHVRSAFQLLPHQPDGICSYIPKGVSNILRFPQSASTIYTFNLTCFTQFHAKKKQQTEVQRSRLANKLSENLETLYCLGTTPTNCIQEECKSRLNSRTFCHYV